MKFALGENFGTGFFSPLSLRKGPRGWLLQNKQNPSAASQLSPFPFLRSFEQAQEQLNEIYFVGEFWDGILFSAVASKRSQGGGCCKISKTLPLLRSSGFFFIQSAKSKLLQLSKEKPSTLSC